MASYRVLLPHHPSPSPFKRAHRTEASLMETGHVYIDFVPSHEWFQDEAADTLIVHVPGFKKEQLRVHIGSDTKLLVSGERPVIKDQWSRFRKEFQLPENCKTDQIHCKLENGLLTIMLPKSRHRGAAKGENAGKEGKEKGGVKETEGDADHGVTRKADATAGIQASRTAPAPQGEAPSDEQTKIQSTVSMDVGLHPHEGKLWVVVLLVAIAVLVWHLYQS